jgi:hypothetical protein
VYAVDQQREFLESDRFQRTALPRSLFVAKPIYYIQNVYLSTSHHYYNNTYSLICQLI